MSLGRAQVFLLYGESDTGKTAQLGRLARYEFERTGRVSRLVSADSGWESIPAEYFVTPDNPDGFIEAWNIQALRDPWTPLVKLTEGYWPRVVVDPVTKAPKVRMMAPGFQDGRILATDGKRQVGQYLFEGISTIGNAGLQDHIRSQRQIGQDLVGKFSSDVEVEAGGKVVRESLTFAKAAPSHFGQVQDFILLDLVPRTGGMPVARVAWTGHEAKGKDEITGMENSVLGPATVGKATVDRTVQKFAHAFHMTVETRFVGAKGQEKIERDFRAWFVKHPDPVLTKMSWPTKVSVPPKLAQELLAKFPGGYIPMGADAGIEQFVDWLAQSDADSQEPGESGTKV